MNHASGRRASEADEIERRPWGKHVVGILEEQVEERCRDYGWRDKMPDNGRPCGPHMVKTRFYAEMGYEITGWSDQQMTESEFLKHHSGCQ